MFTSQPMETTKPDIVDGHCHFYPPATRIGSGAADGGFGPEDLLAKTSYGCLTGLVHVETGSFADAPWKETGWVAGLAQRFKIPVAIIAHANLCANDLPKVIQRHNVAGPVRGIRMRIVTDRNKLRQLSVGDNPFTRPRFRSGYRCLGEHGLLFEAQAPFQIMPDMIALSELYPSMPLVLTHFGFPQTFSGAGFDVWNEHIRILADSENVHLKLSGIGMLLAGQLDGIESAADLLIESLGAHRLIFGSNLPIDLDGDPSLSGCQRLITHITRNHADVADQILRQNAASLYGLSRIAPPVALPGNENC